MKKITLFRSSLVLVLVVLLVIGGNAQALSQLLTYLPIVLNNPSATPTLPPIPTYTPTVTLTPTQSPPKTTGNVEIRNIFFDGAGSSEPDEYVEIENDDSFPIQLQNWTLEDEADHVFTFPSFVIQPDQTCRIYTNENHPEWCGFNYGSGSAIWNNTGDTAYLRDADGTLIDDYGY